MRNKVINNTKVGLFVLAGTVFLILTLYMIGLNRNILGSTFTIYAQVNNVSGLIPGNNIRFKGIDVGTVKSIYVTNDTTIHIKLVINKNMKPYIKKNAKVSIGTDGLMGNKLININSQPGYSETIEEGDVLSAQMPVETDEMLRTLNSTNENIEKMSQNLYEITSKLNQSEAIWKLLSDTLLVEDLKKGVAEFHKSGVNTFEMTEAGKNMALRISQGEGLAYSLFTDTIMSQQLANSLQQIQQATQQTSLIMEDMKCLVESIKQGEGTAGLLLADSLLRNSIDNSVKNIEEGTYNFNQNMEALKSNFLFRSYYRRLEKQNKSELKEKNQFD